MIKVFWIVWAVMGLILEGIALYNGVPNDTLTGTVTTHIPAWALFAGLGWLGWHFTTTYLDGKDQK